MGVEIVGVSFNDPEKNKKWAEKEQFPFELWSDQDRTLALAFGAVSSARALVPSRVTVVIDASGQVVLEYMDGVQVGTHPQDVLDDCKRLFSTPR